MDRLGQERRGVGRVFAHWLGDGYDPYVEAFAQQFLVLAGLDLAAREPRSVEDEHHVELRFGGVCHQSLELGP